MATAKWAKQGPTAYYHYHYSCMNVYSIKHVVILYYINRILHSIPVVSHPVPTFSRYSPKRDNKRPSEVYELYLFFTLLSPRATHDDISYFFYMVKKIVAKTTGWRGWNVIRNSFKMLTGTRYCCYILSGNQTFKSNYMLNICQAPDKHMRLLFVRQASNLQKNNRYLGSKCIFCIHKWSCSFGHGFAGGPFLESTEIWAEVIVVQGQRGVYHWNSLYEENLCSC